jgi:hypothetical protein
LVPRYLLVATDAETLRSAETMAGLPEGSLTGAVTAENLTNNLQMIVTVTSASARRSQVAAGALADRVLDAAARDPLVAARVVLGPTAPTNGTPIRQLLALIAGLLVAAVIGLSLVFVLEGAWPRFRVRDDISALGLPVLSALRRWDLYGRHHRHDSQRRDTSRLSQLRLQVATASCGRCTGSLVVASPTPSDAALVEALVRALAEMVEGPRRPDAAPAGGRLLVRSWLPTEEPAPRGVTAEDCFLLVVSRGTLIEHAQDCVSLLERQGGRAVGGVLLT